MADDVVLGEMLESLLLGAPPPRGRRAEATFLPGDWGGVVEPGNINLMNRPSVKNPAGGTSSVYSMSIGMDDREYLIPRVSDDGRLLTEEEAIREFERTGRHLGAFKSPDFATAYADALHRQQASLGN